MVVVLQLRDAVVIRDGAGHGPTRSARSHGRGEELVAEEREREALER